MRVLAVMGAVVVGCGVAAVAVNLAPDTDDDRADDYNDAVVVIDPSQTSLYPTPTTGVVETTTSTTDSSAVVTDVPVDDTLTTGGDPEVGDDFPGGGSDDGDHGPGDGSDDDSGDDPDVTSSPTTSPSSPVPSESPTPSPTTTPPPDDEDDEDEDEEEEECTPSWWIGCWF